MSSPLPGMADVQIEKLIAALDSLMDGDLAVPMLVACGHRAVPYLEQFLLAGPPKSVSSPRCRAVRALGEIGAYPVLISYFCAYEPPDDAAILFAEDAVRSSVARELLRWRSEEISRVLLSASRQRPTSGLIFALGELRQPESVPLLFYVLEDDFCREEAKQALRKLADAARQYAILSIRNLTEAQLYGPSALCRRRAVLELLGEFGVSIEEWKDLRCFLSEQNAGVVIATASIGISVAPAADQIEIVRALFRISEQVNWVQEDAVIRLLNHHQDLACQIGGTIVEECRKRGENPDWLAPFWRILRHVLGPKLEPKFRAA